SISPSKADEVQARPRMEAIIGILRSRKQGRSASISPAEARKELMAISAVAWDLQKRLRSLEQSHLLVRHSFSHPKSHPQAGLKHQKEKRSMDYFAGLDVSVKETSICIVDDAGKIVREVRVASEPEALLQVLTNNNYRFKRIGLEAGPLSQWLF